VHGSLHPLYESQSRKGLDSGDKKLTGVLDSVRLKVAAALQRLEDDERLELHA
jgi:hypothetical protein